jgi:hypothetical protein
MNAKYETVKETGTHWFIRFDYFKKYGLPDLKLKKDVGPHKDINGKGLHWKIIKYRLKPQAIIMKKYLQ